MRNPDQKIAIHHRAGSFSDRWIDYCIKKGIEYKLVNCYDSDIISQIEDCFALMWHFYQANYKDLLFAKQLLFAVKQSGKIVFPDFNTSWHFDDKVGQKYLFEAIKAPLVPTYVFYEKGRAMDWIRNATFPMVFKLRGGAGSSNVRIVKNRSQAEKIISRAFKSGFSQFNGWRYFIDCYKKVKGNRATYKSLIKGFGRIFIPTEFSRLAPRERGYVYFQNFIPNNDSDIRVIVIGNKSFAVKRFVRGNDFRASGSGIKQELDNLNADKNWLRLAFEITNRLKAQCLAFDFVFDKNNNPLLLEMSYGFAINFYDNCPGYWDIDLNWHEGTFKPQEWMVDLILLESMKMHKK